MRKIDFDHGPGSLFFNDDAPLGEEGQVRAARPSDHNHLPMPEQNEEMAIRMRFSSEQMKRIRFGFIPPGMDFKWFIYYEKETLHFHRSWTGFCVFQLNFTETEKGGAIAQRLLINRNTEEYKGPNAQKCLKTVSQLIQTLLIEGVFRNWNDVV